MATWLAGRTLSDALFAGYLTTLHENGKSPATIGRVVAAVKWQLKHQPKPHLQRMPIMQATLAGIRRDGRNRGRGQVSLARRGEGVYLRRGRRYDRRLTGLGNDTAL